MHPSVFALLTETCETHNLEEKGGQKEGGRKKSKEKRARRERWRFNTYMVDILHMPLKYIQ